MKKLLLVFFLAASALSAEPEEFLLDFGTAESPVAEGFKRVAENSAYSAEAGFGWQSPRGQRLDARNENFSSQRQFLKLDPLLCDHVTGGKKYVYSSSDLTFRLDLPEGEYAGALVMGKMTEQTGSTINRPPFMYRDYAVTVNGSEVLRVERDWVEYLKQTLADNEKDFLPGDSLFEAYVEPYFTTVRFSFAGALTLKTSSLCPWNALLVYPKDRQRELDARLAEMRKQSREFVDDQYDERKPDEVEGLSEDELKQRADKGYVFFSRPNVSVSPHDRPAEQEIGKPATEFLPAGEKGVVAFSVYPVKALKQVNLAFGDLVSDSGSKIPADRLSLWTAHYCVHPAVRTGHRYLIRPWYALPFETTDLAPGIPRTFYLYVKATADCAPGIYKGQIRLTAENMPQGELEVMVKVLPYKLLPSDILFGMYTSTPTSCTLRFASMMLKQQGEPDHRRLTADLQEKIYTEMRESGFNTVSISLPWIPFKIGQAGKIETRPDVWMYWKDALDLYKKVFGDTPMSSFGMGWSSFISPSSVPGFPTRPTHQGAQQPFSPEALAGAEKLLRRFYDEVKANQWAEVIFYVSDELNNYGLRGGQFGEKLAAAYRTISDKVGFRICASMNGPAEHGMLPYLHMAIPNGAFPVNEEALAGIRKAGCDLWFYNIGSNRFTEGYFIAKTRPKGRLQWAFGPCSRYFENVPSLPSLGHLGYSLILDSNFTVGKRHDVEELRQGILDYRYFITLEKLVRENASAADPALAKAVEKGRKLMDYVLGGIKVDLKHYSRVGMWTPKTCQRIRWMLASAIQEIDDAKK